MDARLASRCFNLVRAPTPSHKTTPPSPAYPSPSIVSFLPTRSFLLIGCSRSPVRHLFTPWRSCNRCAARIQIDHSSYRKQTPQDVYPPPVFMRVCVGMCDIFLKSTGPEIFIVDTTKSGEGFCLSALLNDASFMQLFHAVDRGDKDGVTDAR
jgi:hypothetical protein